MELIAAGAKREVDGAAGVPSAFRAGLGLGGKLVDGVERKDDAGDAGHTALINGGNVVPQIVVIDAIDLPVHLVGAGAVERYRSRRRSSRRSRESRQSVWVKSRPFNGISATVLASRTVVWVVGGGIERDRSGTDFDRLLIGRDREFHR